MFGGEVERGVIAGRGGVEPEAETPEAGVAVRDGVGWGAVGREGPAVEGESQGIGVEARGGGVWVECRLLGCGGLLEEGRGEVFLQLRSVYAAYYSDTTQSLPRLNETLIPLA